VSLSEISLQASRKNGAQLRAQAMVFRRPDHAGAVGIEQGSDQGGALGLGESRGHTGKGDGRSDAGRDAELALRDVEQAGEASAASGDDAAGAEGFEDAAVTKVVAQHMEELAGAGLEDFAEQALI